MTKVATVTNFIKQVTAQLTGDQNVVIATKNARKADSALLGQLAALNSKSVDLESLVEDAQEALYLAKYPKTLITDNSSFLNNVKRASEALETAKENLANVEESIAFFTALQNEYSVTA